MALPLDQDTTSTASCSSALVPLKGEAAGIVHDKQKWMDCAVHTANNLLQTSAFSHATFEGIADDLAELEGIRLAWLPWRNPHRHALGLGNYDVNVLLVALQRHDRSLSTAYFDGRKDPMKPSDLDLPRQTVGFICNVTKRSLWGLRTSSHWYAVRRVGLDGIWHNFDSKLKNPASFGHDRESGEDGLRKHLASVLLSHGTLIVVERPGFRRTLRKRDIVFTKLQEYCDKVMDTCCRRCTGKRALALSDSDHRAKRRRISESGHCVVAER